jgi:hypothetical protein
MRTHYWIRAALGVGLTALAVAAPAGAATTSSPTLTSTEEAAVHSVMAAAAQLPTPTTPAQFNSDRPALVAVVASALKQGKHVAHVLALSGNPAVFADVVTLRKREPLPGVTVDSEGNEELAIEVHTATVAPKALFQAQQEPTASVARRRGHVKAHSAGCWGSHAHKNGSELGVIEIEEAGWCGNGSSITWNGGANFRWYSYVGNCMQDVNTSWSWDVPYSWIHGGIWASEGWGIKGACYIQERRAATERIAANGYWDTNY